MSYRRALYIVLCSYFKFILTIIFGIRLFEVIVVVCMTTSVAFLIVYTTKVKALRNILLSGVVDRERRGREGGMGRY